MDSHLGSRIFSEGKFRDIHVRKILGGKIIESILVLTELIKHEFSFYVLPNFLQ